jgi:hypothetical protein
MAITEAALFEAGPVSSAVPSELGRFGRIPGNKLPGYYQTSLRDDRDVKLLSYPHLITPPVGVA